MTLGDGCGVRVRNVFVVTAEIAEYHTFGVESRGLGRMWVIGHAWHDARIARLPIPRDHFVPGPGSLDDPELKHFRRVADVGASRSLLENSF